MKYPYSFLMKLAILGYTGIPISGHTEFPFFIGWSLHLSDRWIQNFQMIGSYFPDSPRSPYLCDDHFCFRDSFFLIYFFSWFEVSIILPWLFLVGGLEQFYTFYDFPETVGNGMSSSQLTIRPWFFSGVGEKPPTSHRFLGSVRDDHNPRKYICFVESIPSYSWWCPRTKSRSVGEHNSNFTMVYRWYMVIYLCLIWFINQLIIEGAPPCTNGSSIDEALQSWILPTIIYP